MDIAFSFGGTMAVTVFVTPWIFGFEGIKHELFGGHWPWEGLRRKQVTLAEVLEQLDRDFSAARKEEAAE
jgi:hypothetical protein